MTKKKEMRFHTTFLLITEFISDHICPDKDYPLNSYLVEKHYKSPHLSQKHLEFPSVGNGIYTHYTHEDAPKTSPKDTMYYARGYKPSVVIREHEGKYFNILFDVYDTVVFTVTELYINELITSPRKKRQQFKQTIKSFIKGLSTEGNDSYNDDYVYIRYDNRTSVINICGKEMVKYLLTKPEWYRLEDLSRNRISCSLYITKLYINEELNKM